MPTLGQISKVAVPAGMTAAQWFASRRGLNNATQTVTQGAQAAGQGIQAATTDAQRMQSEALGEQRQMRDQTIGQNQNYVRTGEMANAGYQDLIEHPRTFDPSSVATDPGYQFGLSEGLKGGDRTAQSRGTLGNGGQVRAQTRYALDYATTKYNDALDRFRKTQSDRKDLLQGGITIGQNANTADQNARNTYGTQVGENATRSGNLGVNAAEDQAALTLAQSQAQATNQVQGSNNTLNTIGKLADTGIGLVEKLAPSLGLTLGGASSAALPLAAQATVGGALAGAPGALAAPGAIAAPTGVAAAGGGAGLFGLGSATIPVIGGIIAGGALLANHFIGQGRKAADKLTGEGGIAHAFEDTLAQIDAQPEYTPDQKWQSKVQAYEKLVELGTEFAKKGENERKVAVQMFDTISPLFGKPNPLRAA